MKKKIKLNKKILPDLVKQKKKVKEKKQYNIRENERLAREWKQKKTG